MATKAETADFIVSKLSGLNVRVRRMFGEYALYCDEKVVGLICDDQLYIKITEPGKKLMAESYEEGAPYPGAKPYIFVSESFVEDSSFLKRLVSVTCELIPRSKKK